MTPLRVIRPDEPENGPTSKSPEQSRSVLHNLQFDLNVRLIRAAGLEVSPLVLFGPGNPGPLPGETREDADARQFRWLEAVSTFNSQAAELRNNPPRELWEQSSTPPPPTNRPNKPR